MDTLSGQRVFRFIGGCMTTEGRHNSVVRPISCVSTSDFVKDDLASPRKMSWASKVVQSQRHYRVRGNGVMSDTKSTARDVRFVPFTLTL